MRGAANVTLQTHQILRLPRKMTIQHLTEICWKQLKRHFQCAADPTMIRPWSDHDPTMIRDRSRQSATRRATELTFRAPDEHFVLKNTTFRAPAIFPNFTKYCACHEKWHLTFTKYCACHEKCHLTFTKYCACHEKWHLTFTKYCPCHEKWHLTFTKYCACHEKWHLTFTKYCTCHEKLHLTCTKYCACHTEWLACLILVTYETSFPMRGATNVTLQRHQILRLPRKMTIQHLTEICWKQLKRHFQCAADPTMIRPWSDHDPRPFPSFRNPPRNRAYLSRSGRAFCIEKYNISRSGYLSKFQQVLHLPRKVTLGLHQVLHLPQKVTLDLYQVLRLPRKMTLDLHQVLRLPRKVTLDLHQVLRLPRKVTRMLEPRHIWLLDSTITKRFYYLTLLLRNDSITWLYYYETILLLDSTIAKWFYYLTLLLLSDSITWLYYF